MSNEQRLIDILAKRQRQLGESDLQFSRRLGMSRQTWQLVRTGGMLPGRRTLQGISTAFPDLQPSVLAFLLGQNASIVECVASEVEVGS